MIGTDRKPLQEEPLSLGLISHIYLWRLFGNQRDTFSTLLQKLSVETEIGRLVMWGMGREKEGKRRQKSVWAALETDED